MQDMTFEEVVTLERNIKIKNKAKEIEGWIKYYSTEFFGEPKQGEHGKTVDSCHAKALRIMIPILANAIRKLKEKP